MWGYLHEMWGYPYEDHGDRSVDERWRRALTREDAVADMGRTSSRNMWDHVHPLNDLYVPEHERRAAIGSVDDLIEDILSDA